MERGWKIFVIRFLPALRWMWKKIMSETEIALIRRVPEKGDSAGTVKNKYLLLDITHKPTII